MHLIRWRWRSLRVRLALALVALLAGAALLAACGGDDDDDGAATSADAAATATGTPIPTATPYASVPAPTTVASPTPQPTTVAASGDVEYVVEPGDTLYAIADRYGTTVEAIMERNDITDAGLIFVGQRLLVPEGYIPEDDGSDDAGSDDGADSGDSSDDGTGSGDTYVVQPGDTAYDIALRFEVTLEELAAANGTTVDALGDLMVGDELVIP